MEMFFSSDSVVDAFFSECENFEGSDTTVEHSLGGNGGDNVVGLFWRVLCWDKGDGR